jgi:2-methylcitrate dehydratase PrpD
MASAFGIAGANSPVASIMKTVLGPLGRVTMVKNNYGMSSAAGVLGAYLARNDFVGPPDILDGDQGFWVMAGSDQCNFGSMTDRLGAEYRILDVKFKFYPACRWLHTGIDAALQIVREHGLSIHDLQSVIIKTNSVLTKRPYDNRRPENMMEAQFSFPFSLAVAMSGIEIGPDWFSEETLRNPEILALADKIRLERYDESDKVGRIDEVLSKVQVQVAGKTFIREVRYARGHPKSPKGIDEHEQKFLSLAGPVVGADKARDIVGLVKRLEETPDIVELTRLLPTS